MMTNTSTTDRTLQLRKVAILVATLGEPLGEQLLADLPAREEAAVRQILDELDEIDPTEYRTVLADFRQGLASSPPPATTRTPRTRTEGVELDASLLARMETYAAPDFVPPKRPKSNPWQALSDADASTLVEMLSAEQPQTIAVVLSRLETAQASALLTRLAPSLQTEVLTRLADLDPADEQTLEVVASQLSEWLAAHTRRHQRMAAGRDLVQRILRDTPDNQRGALLRQLGTRNPTLAGELSNEQRNSTAIDQPPQPVRTASHTPVTTTTLAPSRDLAGTSLDPLADLESLDDRALLTALRQAERRTVLLALAGAGEGLLKRIVRGLPRRQAAQFRQQVRGIGPTRLSEITAAQRELVRLGLNSMPR